MTFNRLLSALTLPAVLLLAGCGEPVYPVKGQVVYKDGMPLPQARILLEAVDRSHSINGEIDILGEFTLAEPRRNGCRPGDYKVVITHHIAHELDNEFEPVVTARYASFETTPLRCTVKPEKNVFVFEVAPPDESEKTLPAEKPTGIDSPK